MRGAPLSRSEWLATRLLAAIGLSTGGLAGGFTPATDGAPPPTVAPAASTPSAASRQAGDPGESDRRPTTGTASAEPAPMASSLARFEVPPTHPEYVSPLVTAKVAPLVCGKDEVRELQCFLQPPSACLAELAPGQELENPLSGTQRLGGSAGRRVRDGAMVARPRYKAMPQVEEPCCYSSCYALVPSSPKPVAKAGATGLRGSLRKVELCFPAPEAGTRMPAPAPHGSCAAGIVWPHGGERGVALDTAMSSTSSTTEREPMCCYSRTEQFIGPVDGRPLLVEGQLRAAPLSRGSSGWSLLAVPSGLQQRGP
jgi:hypothetical protein